MIRSLARAALAALLVLVLAAPALAHRVNIFAWAEAGQIHTQSKFQGGNTVSQGTVEVLDAATGKVLLNGTTDGEGNFAFPAPEEARAGKLTLRVVIKAGEGHQGQWDLPPEDYLAAAEAPTAPAAPAPAAAAAPAAAPADIQKLVDQAVEAKLAPLRKQIAELAEPGPGAAGILGGLGFLMGLAGMVMASRRRKG